MKDEAVCSTACYL